MERKWVSGLPGTKKGTLQKDKNQPANKTPDQFGIGIDRVSNVQHPMSLVNAIDH
jgi:hypothetical protein